MDIHRGDEVSKTYRGRWVAKGDPSRAWDIDDRRDLCSNATADLFEVSFRIGVRKSSRTQRDLCIHVKQAHIMSPARRRNVVESPRVAQI